MYHASTVAAIAHSRLWHFCDIARSRMDVRFRGLTRTLSRHRRMTECDPNRGQAAASHLSVQAWPRAVSNALACSHSTASNFLDCSYNACYGTSSRQFSGISPMKASSRARAPTTVKRTVRRGRRPNGHYRTREYLTEREVERLMKAAGRNRYGHRDATMILLAFRHGLRASELCSLRWGGANLNCSESRRFRPAGLLDQR